MKYYSTENHRDKVEIIEAVFRGIASSASPEQSSVSGLWMPEQIPVLGTEELERIYKMTLPEMGREILFPFFSGSLSSKKLLSICEDSFNFPIPLVPINEDCSCLELFHGPTLAFKDVAARFMARILSDWASEPIHILVATSGDTGGAVASGFFEVPNTSVTILYPSGMVSPLQEKQLTTFGGNISAIEVQGTFDDCQALVKRALKDPKVHQKMKVTTANSINIARLLPQMVYFFWLWKQVKEKSRGEEKPLVISVPSGNFGNLTAGLMARKMGLPIKAFIASNNENDSVCRYLENGHFEARPTFRTLSNAMDVGAPSNFTRMLDLFGERKIVDGNKVTPDEVWKRMKTACHGFSTSDKATVEAIRQVYLSDQYLMDPHGAVGYLGLKDYRKHHAEPVEMVFLETAHPAKFPKTIDEKMPEIPETLKRRIKMKKESIPISNSYSEFLKVLL